MTAHRRVIGIVQPTYLPWLPFFERMACSDVFVLLDDVEYSKNSFFNRNSIKTAQGRLLLTAPVKYKGNSRLTIAEMPVDDRVPWQKKHFRTIEQAYARAAYWPQYRDQLEAIYAAPCETLMDIVMPLIMLLKDAFGIDTPMILSSALAIAGERNEKLVSICKRLDGTHFIVKPGTEGYHPPAEFLPYGVSLAYLSYSKPVYPQLHGAFEGFLSALDYLLNCGPGRPPFDARIDFAEVPA